MKTLSLSFGSLVVPLAAFALLGCSSDPSGPGGSGGQGGGGGDAVAALDAMFQAACARQVECGYPVLNSANTVEACLSLQKHAAGDVPETLGDGAVVLRQDRLIACKAAFEAASCEIVANLGIELDPACTTYWEGTVAEGEPCAGGVVNDCEAGTFCAFEGGACPGVCTKEAPACVEGSCGDGMYCDAFGKCTPRAALGESCGPVVEGALFESSCVEGAHCPEDTCVARVPAGESCTGMYALECVEGYTCQCDDAGCSTLSCAPAAGKGEPCGSPTACAEGRYCDFDTGTCADRGEEGAPCSESMGACAPGLACIDGVCGAPASQPAELLPLLEANGDCKEGGICPLGTTCLCVLPGCSDGAEACLPGPGLGESCVEALEVNYTPFVCAEGVCDIFETFTCIEPAAPGAACSGTLTMACGSFLCLEGKCATLEESRCDAN